MPVKQLKSRPSAAPAAASQSAPRLNADALRHVAREAGRSLPPALVTASQQKVLINVKVTAALADALADRAEAEGITQKQVITRALAAAGLPVPDVDLEDGTRRRIRMRVA